ncbi:helix-turn-helix domain-containing protein [Herbaspirillum sp. WKF16]|jgi:transcriptional regulator GlxA family with amidase domain|uniref:GlxA family transcriptional regulator n=1 Tax=Herbaspirillum sp. WKF16 TaxID=3028312 RepID=UPI0023A9F444|nr:helix-turn-helix domain-containing protein [Herbaspirillum sp. WKF16]WDZ95223.1 helix-turn-helix domain-containing protein [Herbaspirillum sp. WKF16]
MESFQTIRLVEEPNPIRHIGIIVFDGVVLADIVGAAEVFVVGDKMISSVFAGSTGYRLSLISLAGGMVMSSSAVQVMTSSLPQADNHHFDSLIIASGSGNFDAYHDAKLIAWLQQAQVRVRRIAALCTGVFILGAAGLLDKRRATTHWALRDKLQREFPQIVVERDALITQDGEIFTASDAGMGADIALRLLEEDLGTALAKRVAQSLVTHQRQREAPHTHVTSHRVDDSLRNGRIHKALRWLEENMASPVSMNDAANFVSMSERNFQRQFKRETGLTPHGFLLKIRLEAVRQHLRETDLPVDKIARRCGFFSGEHVAKLFRKHLDTSPVEYRRSERALQPQQSQGATDPAELASCKGEG